MRTPRTRWIAAALGLALIGAVVSFETNWFDTNAGRAPERASTRDRAPRPLAARPNTASASSDEMRSIGRTEANEDRGASRRRSDVSSPDRGPGPCPDPDPELEAIRSTLSDAIAVHLPRLSLSDRELDELASATRRLRDAQAELRTIPETREYADRRATLNRRLENAVADFTYLVDLTPGEFTRRVAPAEGIDEWNPDGPRAPVDIRPIAAKDARE